MTVSINREPFRLKLWDEILPLAQKCWDESSDYRMETCSYHGARDIAVDPDIESYCRLAENNAMVLVTLRDEAKLLGYVVGFIHRSMHHKNTLCGFGDSIYVEPDYRAYTTVLAERFEREMKQLNVDIIGWPVHIKGPIYEVLKARGYVGDDTVMEKRLCA